MRWESLFADLEAQLERERAVDEDQLVIEGERHRLAGLTLVDRMKAFAPHREMQLRLVDGRLVRLSERSFGQGWLIGEVRPPRTGFGTMLVPLHAVAGMVVDPDNLADTTSVVSDPAPRLSDRLRLPMVLRDLSRRRATVQITTAAERVTGTIDRVASDHLDVAVHEPDLPRRASVVRTVEVIPLTALISVSC